MHKTKYFIIFFSIILFLSNCGYVPRYGMSEKNVNFNIEILSLNGDRDFNSSIKTKLNRYTNNSENQSNIFKIKTNSKYEKLITSKDSSGAATNYELKITAQFIILKNGKEKEIIMKETFKMKKLDDSFEENQYEKVIKDNFAEIIVDKLILYLYQI